MNWFLTHYILTTLLVLTVLMYIGGKCTWIPFLGLVCALFGGIVAPIAMLAAVWFIRWDKEPSHGTYGDTDPTVAAYDNIIRGDLPSWLSWFSTPDERFPGGMYELTVRELYQKNADKWWGKYLCSYVWAGLRNQGMGFARALGKPAIGFVPDQVVGFWERTDDDVWLYSKYLNAAHTWQFVCGWQITHLPDNSFLAVPLFTIKKR